MADVSSGTPEEFPSDCPEPIIKAAVWRGGRTAWKTTDYFRHKAEQCPIASPLEGRGRSGCSVRLVAYFNRS